MWIPDTDAFLKAANDTKKRIIEAFDSLKQMRDLGNTLIVVEHDMDTMKKCDYLVDIGPDAGEKGGEIVAVGTPEQIVKNERSYTGKFLKKNFYYQRN